MTKKYCDVCGKELSYAEGFTAITLNMIIDGHEREEQYVELCSSEECGMKAREFIHGLKGVKRIYN